MAANVIQFPCKPRVAANDPNPWLSAETVSEPDLPSFIKKRRIVDPVSGVEYLGYVVEDEKPKRRVGRLCLG